MTINVIDDDGVVIAHATLALDDRKVMTLQIDDERGLRAFVGLNVVTGVLAGELEHAAEKDDRLKSELQLIGEEEL